jgi:hypothetical protein
LKNFYFVVHTKNKNIFKEMSDEDGYSYQSKLQLVRCNAINEKTLMSKFNFDKFEADNQMLDNSVNNLVDVFNSIKTNNSNININSNSISISNGNNNT